MPTLAYDGDVPLYAYEIREPFYDQVCHLIDVIILYPTRYSSIGDKFDKVYEFIDIEQSGKYITTDIMLTTEVNGTIFELNLHSKRDKLHFEEVTYDDIGRLLSGN